MNFLYLLRHAEAGLHQNDFERPLTPKGKADMVRLGGIIKDKNYAPGRILCSPAQRTRQTLGALGIGGPAPVFEESIYEASPGELLGLIQESGSVSSLMLVGHNPGVHGLAVMLAERGEGIQSLRTGYPPGTLAVIAFEEEWADIAPGSGLLTYFNPGR